MENPVEDEKQRAVGKLLGVLPNPWRKVAIRAVIGFSVLGALIGVIGNFSSAASGVCSVRLLKATCSAISPWLGVSADDANAAPALKAIIGTWGLPARNGQPACRDPLTYSVEKEGDDQFVHVRARDFDSTARIADARGMSLFTRTVSPRSDAGHQWELRIESDRLVQVDANNTSTTLVRCSDK